MSDKEEEDETIPFDRLVIWYNEHTNDYMLWVSLGSFFVSFIVVHFIL